MPDPADIGRIRRDPELLERYRLPQEPDRGLEPELWRLWDEMLSGGKLRFVRADTVEAHRAVENGPPLPRATRLQSSRNWSGAVLAPNHGQRIVMAGGRWEVPREVKAGALTRDSKQRGWLASVWVGIDGQRRWSPSMPQIGTKHPVDRHGTPMPPFAWWQWWLRDHWSNYQEIRGIPVQPGDRMLAMLTLLSPCKVRFHLRNATQGPMTSFDVTAAKLRQDGEWVRLPALGSSAEWVVERPGDAESCRPLDLFELPDYGSVVFTRCAARAAKRPGDPVRRRELAAPRLIRMVALRDDDPRSRLVSVPRMDGEEAASVRVSFRRP